MHRTAGVPRSDLPGSAEDLSTVVYEELRQLAAAKMANESPGQTLQPTALVHEAWLRLAAGGAEPAMDRWENRAHFFGAAAEAMRRILIDRARKKQAVRHGGGLDRTALDDIEIPERAGDEVLLRVNDALEALGRDDPRSAELVKLRFFGGLGVEEAGRALGISERTARRCWRFARAWLRDTLSRGAD
ncbi:MAG: sigma-70 family RNA polymerase sigma factor [Verrucomicrobiales bacterium]|nr:sigma-70 family RNA polymerase sigma factor [Verrucomicrobiales bacterium]